MATAALVNNDIEVGRRIVAALARAAIPVTIYLWAFIPQLQEWQFMIATPLVDTKGPLAAYGEVNKALQREHIFDDAPMRRIFLRSPNDRVLKSLERESRAVPHEAFRVVNEQIAGSFVEDAYLYRGFIQINQLQGKTNSPVYSVFYAPHEGPGGFVPGRKISGIDQLTHFLEISLHLSQTAIQSALRSLEAHGSATVANIELKNKDLKRLRLA
jgi:hypothetical protein